MADRTRPEPGIGLALSGGGFRATLFHLGSLWRLNELGWLPKLARITSVSGGSITAGLLGLHWSHLTFDDLGIATNFKAEVAVPLQTFCSQTIDVWAGIQGILTPFRSIGQEVAKRYQKHLFGNATLQDLPSDAEGPRFIIYATSLQSGASVRFSKPYMADYRVGRVDDPRISLAVAVAASSAFPPFLSPVILDTEDLQWSQMSGTDLFGREQFRSRMYLTDGGVYDNLGLEVLWDRYQTVLVSDAGAPFDVAEKPPRDWLRQAVRVIGTSSEQTRALRKRKLIGDYINKVREGTYWGVATDIDDYSLPDAMLRDNNLTGRMAKVRTRLNRFKDREQGHLINWGYALADTAMRRHVLPPGMSPGAWPVPEYALG